MKKYLLYIVIFLIGALAGMWAHRQYHFRDATNMSQNDTIVRLDTIKYSKLELIGKNYNLDVPKIGSPELIYIPTHSLDTIYRDNIQYVTYPRQYFYTSTDDVEIWHSGIDSTIDSLNVVRKTTNITNTTHKTDKKHSIGIGVEARYLDRMYAPVYVQYESRITPWLAVYGQVGYDIPTKQWGVNLGTRLQIQW